MAHKIYNFCVNQNSTKTNFARLTTLKYKLCIYTKIIISFVTFDELNSNEQIKYRRASKSDKLRIVHFVCVLFLLVCFITRGKLECKNSLFTRIKFTLNCAFSLTHDILTFIKIYYRPDNQRIRSRFLSVSRYLHDYNYNKQTFPLVRQTFFFIFVFVNSIISKLLV